MVQNLTDTQIGVDVTHDSILLVTPQLRTFMTPEAAEELGIMLIQAAATLKFDVVVREEAENNDG